MGFLKQIEDGMYCLYKHWNSTWILTVLEEYNPHYVSCFCKVKGLVFYRAQTSSLFLEVPCRVLWSETYTDLLQMRQYVWAFQMSLQITHKRF